MLKVKILTIFPELFPGFLGTSLTGRALTENKWSIEVINIRDYALDKHKSVDDTPCGGGAGMIMRCDVLGRAIQANCSQGGKIFYMSPRGATLTQSKARQLSTLEEITIICGRFEGIDERVIEYYNIEEISIGDYILTGGEQAAQIMLDSVIRLLPDVLGNQDSLSDESFENNLLEYPQYTRPVEWNGLSVPEVLISGHHKNINIWRQQRSEEITKQKRPDVYQKYLDLKKH